MDALDFSNLDENTIENLLDEIEQNEEEIDEIDAWIRSEWKIGSIVECFCDNTWNKGIIIKICSDFDDDILHVKSTQNGAIHEWKRNEMEFIRPFSRAMTVYTYIFNAIMDDVGFYSDHSDTATPEPQDTPQPILEIDSIKLNYLDNIPQLTLSDDYSLDEIGATQIEQSRSLELRTCTKIKSSSSSIKCITPTTQSIAENKIKNYFRRRSVANIDHTIHRLFQLDPDLLKIREEYLERLDNDSDSNE